MISKYFEINYDKDINWAVWKSKEYYLMLHCDEETNCYRWRLNTKSNSLSTWTQNFYYHRHSSNIYQEIENYMLENDLLWN